MVELVYQNNMNYTFNDMKIINELVCIWTKRLNQITYV